MLTDVTCRISCKNNEWIEYWKNWLLMGLDIINNYYLCLLKYFTTFFEEKSNIRQVGWHELVLYTMVVLKEPLRF